MTKRFLFTAACFALAASVACGQDDRSKGDPGYSDTPVLPGQPWRVHDIKRPHPRKVAVPPATNPAPAPSDAIVLFDGKDLSKWVQRGRGADRGKTVEPKWKVQDGYVEIARRTGDLVSKDKFGTAQYHIEWCIPKEVGWAGQWRGNSGVIVMGRYEIQVLESHDNVTYADGQAGAIYGQWPPLVNPARPQGEWQSYDIIFEAPKFDSGKLVKPAYVTLFFNGVLVHHRQEVIGQMAHRIIRPYEPHDPEAPLSLQDHDVQVRYRNIWVRPLGEYDKQ